MGNVVVGVVSLLLIAVGLCYFLATMGGGLLEGRRQIRVADGMAPRRRRADGDEEPGETPTSVYFLVPCLNEEAVIGSTLEALLVSPNVRVVVVDDASDDRTANVVASFAGRNVVLMRRFLPDARNGKGPALNAGLPTIAADVARRGLDPENVLVCVMDADGTLSEGALDHVLPLFTDPRVGGVQLGVRISNRKANLLTTMQDFEFWGISATSQMGRVGLGTVSLGGNGQFTRLSALLGLGRPPWSSALTEDLDLSITLMLAGWRLSSTRLAAVYQEGLESLPKLLRQRTRWFQGHMSCGRRLGELWRCRSLPNLALMETSAYLLVPWMFVLPWSILFHIALWEMVRTISQFSSGGLRWQSGYSQAVTGVTWYLLAFAPSLFAGYVYQRQDRGVGRLRSVLLGHLLVPFNYVAFVSAWRAAFRIARRRTAWDKTARRPEAEPMWVAEDAIAAVLTGAAMDFDVPSAPRPVVRGRMVVGAMPTQGTRAPTLVRGQFRVSEPS